MNAFAEPCSDPNQIDRTGGVVWPASTKLAEWVSKHITWTDQASMVQTSAIEPPHLKNVCSALELGAGTGSLSLTLASLGCPTVVATDGDEETCRLCAATNAARSQQVSVLALRWGEDHSESVRQRETALACTGGKCAELLILSDVLYTGLEQAAALERTLRALIGAGGCRFILMCWQERFCSSQAEGFLARLEDLTSDGAGEAQTVWRGWAPRAGNQAWESGESQLRGAISLLVL
jgi:hypothetical protein